MSAPAFSLIWSESGNRANDVCTLSSSTTSYGPIGRPDVMSAADLFTFGAEIMQATPSTKTPLYASVSRHSGSIISLDRMLTRIFMAESRAFLWHKYSTAILVARGYDSTLILALSVGAQVQGATWVRVLSLVQCRRVWADCSPPSHPESIC